MRPPSASVSNSNITLVTIPRPLRPQLHCDGSPKSRLEDSKFCLLEYTLLRNFSNLALRILLFNSVSYVFLLLCLCIHTAIYDLFCTFSFHRANWHTSATLTEVFPCFFLSCKENAKVKLTKMGHGPHSSYLLKCVVLCTVCV